MKMIYEMPEVAVVNLRMEAAILQGSGNLTLDDYGNGITDEWK